MASEIGPSVPLAIGAASAKARPTAPRLAGMIASRASCVRDSFSRTNAIAREATARGSKTAQAAIRMGMTSARDRSTIAAIADPTTGHNAMRARRCGRANETGALPTAASRAMKPSS
jgi:hypothetical protein